MNINEAKIQISNAMTAYFTKDRFGNYVIPVEKQRPVFLIGPPGIGKTAIMEEIAEDLGVGLVSYSMTHHTRQSALGLPFIEKKVYDGEEYSVSEYTMSEIIASVYDTIEKTGYREGILFLDEINCVSETLAPAMLQFLQYKVFGRHKVPKGWIVVTAGNPPEYNNSVRDFDIVTWDRLKRIDVEPDYEAWKTYALRKGTHPSITTYLEIKKANFYKIESTPEGKSFVTARGWSDLSDMINLYEQNGITVDEKLCCQYIQDRKISKDFAVYYDLFNKYKSDYQIENILDGKADKDVKDRAKKAKFDEKLSLLGLLIDELTAKAKEEYNEEKVLENLLSTLKEAKVALAASSSDAGDFLDSEIAKRNTEIENGTKAGSMSGDTKNIIMDAVETLEKEKASVPSKGPEALKKLAADFTARANEIKGSADVIGKNLSSVFKFSEEVFGDGQEMLILVTELTAGYYTASFISRYGCKEYFAHNKELMFYERQKDIMSGIEELEI